MTAYFAGQGGPTDDAPKPISHAEDPRAYKTAWMRAYRARQRAERAEQPAAPKPPKPPFWGKPTSRTHVCVTCGESFLRPAGRPGPSPRCNACREASRKAKAPQPTTSRHVIAAVHFQGHPGPSGTAPVECTCGFATTVDEWLEHRRAQGLTIHIGRPAGGAFPGQGLG